MAASGAEDKASRFDLKKNYTFYGAYHSDPINKLIHICCVWPILFSALLLLHLTPTLPSLPSLPVPWGGALALNLAPLVSLNYVWFYLRLDPRMGGVAAALVVACYLGSHALLQALGASLAWKVGLGFQVFCWTAQFIGHGAFEGRAPALLDNLEQAFKMAPFFVLLEVLHDVAQFEPEAGFWSAVEKDIAAEKAKFKAKSS